MVRQELAQRLLGAARSAPATPWSQAGAVRLHSAMPMPSEKSPSDDEIHAKDGKVLHPHLLNENVTKTQYAVRGELYLRAEQLRKEGKEIIFTNGQCGGVITRGGFSFLDADVYM